VAETKRCLESGIYNAYHFFNNLLSLLTDTKVNNIVRTIFLKEMLVDNSFYDRVIKLDRLKPIIHNYPIVETRGLPSQNCGS
jgi:hypothetical protein